jgi:hypothetical protein
MTSSLESSSSSESEEVSGPSTSRFKLGVVAAASVLAGGLVAAWWHRKTLKKLRQADENIQNPHFWISEDDSMDEA